MLKMRNTDATDQHHKTKLTNLRRRRFVLETSEVKAIDLFVHRLQRNPNVTHTETVIAHLFDELEAEYAVEKLRSIGVTK